MASITSRTRKMCANESVQTPNAEETHQQMIQLLTLHPISRALSSITRSRSSSAYHSLVLAATILGCLHLSYLRSN